jgi:hypothetical protein
MDPRSFLVRLARQSAETWNALAKEAFRGEATFETGNSVYCFKDGTFLRRAKKPERSFEQPTDMMTVRLLGFLGDEGGLWSLSQRWRMGSIALLWKPEAPEEKSFILTSPTVAFSIEAPALVPRSSRKTPSTSNIYRRGASRPPTLRRPAPPSMTRILPGDPHPSGER